MTFIACHKIIQFLNYKWFVFEIKGYLLAVTLKTHWISFSTQVMQWYLIELMIDSGSQDAWSINSVSLVFWLWAIVLACTEMFVECLRKLQW